MSGLTLLGSRISVALDVGSTFPPQAVSVSETAATTPHKPLVENSETRIINPHKLNIFSARISIQAQISSKLHWNTFTNYLIPQ
jgi:hypothetical protein